jgi:hypothetical protein
MVLISYFAIGLNLIKALQQIKDLGSLAIPLTLVFIAVTIATDLIHHLPVI